MNSAVTSLLLCLALTRVALAELTVQSDVHYGSKVGADGVCRQTVTIYSDPALPKAPVFVYFHGGGWKKGDAKEMPLSGAQWHHSLGYATVSVNYRLRSSTKKPNDEATPEEQMQDIWTAMAFIRKHAAEYHLDPDHIVVGGTSAGGQLSACIAYCGKDGVGGDWLANSQYAAQMPAIAASIRGYIGFSAAVGIVNGDTPVGHVTAGAPPALLMDGSADGYFPAIQSFCKVDLAGKAVPYKLLIIPDGEHMIDSTTVYLEGWSKLPPEVQAKVYHSDENAFAAQRTLLRNEIQQFLAAAAKGP